MKTNFKVTSWSFKIKTWKWMWNSFIKMWCNVLTRPNLRLQWSSSPSIHRCVLQWFPPDVENPPNRASGWVIDQHPSDSQLPPLNIRKEMPPNAADLKIWIWIKQRNWMDVSAYLNWDHLSVSFCCTSTSTRPSPHTSPPWRDCILPPCQYR